MHKWIVTFAVAIILALTLMSGADGREDPTDHTDHTDHTTERRDDTTTFLPPRDTTRVPDTTESPREHHEDQRPKRIEKHDKSAPLDVASTDWWWVGPVVAAVFLVFFLSTNRVKRLGGISIRQWLVRYFSAEPLIEGTMKGASAHVLIEQRNAEYGHQFLSFCACATLGLDWGFNENRDERYVVSALAAVQLVMLFGNLVCDIVLLRSGFIRPVRTINTKLRFAHCIYQVGLFCTDALSTGFDLAMPIDCFIWASIHYVYEAIALAVEGLNVIGMSELAIIVLLNGRLMMSTTAITGWRAAFALTSMGLSSVSLLAGLLWKMTHLHAEDRLCREDEERALLEGHGHGHDEHSHGHARGAEELQLLQHGLINSATSATYDSTGSSSTSHPAARPHGQNQDGPEYVPPSPAAGAPDPPKSPTPPAAAIVPTESPPPKADLPDQE
jgi:hypothetical protein